ncbi:MAG: hypothetical protein GWP18_06755 [Proteobacteria bacterium]|nr:hypothetical protein [Pseudomonadota bacterium]
MNTNQPLIAGERLEDLEAALDYMCFTVDDRGEITMTGAVPEHLSRCLERALITIENETSTQGHGTCGSAAWHPMRQLLLRIGRVVNGI